MAVPALEILTDEFNRFPGIGRKTAQRLAFYVMEMEKEDVERLAKAIYNVKETVMRCKECGNISDREICEICDDYERDSHIICVVEDARDIIAMEKGRIFKGKYHVLGGKISPLQGIGVDDINIRGLVNRISEGEITEVIIALNPDLEGETTGMYITKILKPFDIRVTKIASGIPMGGNIEFSDMATIAKSMEGRYEIK